jgi:probable HAF family extracellular repeat protein
MVPMNTLRTTVTKLPILCGIAALMTLGINPSAMAAILYDLTEVGKGEPYGINDAGQVVGQSYPAYPDKGNRAFVWSKSSGMTDLGTLPGGSSSVAYDINDAGQVVGKSGSSKGDRAFVWSKSSGMTDLGTLGGSSVATGINNAGQVVGSSNLGLTDDSPPPTSRAFLWSKSTGMTNLGTLGGGDFGNYSGASDINDAGQVVGSTSTNDTGLEDAFVWTSSGGMTSLDTIFGSTDNSASSAASAINNVGDIAGSIYDPTGAYISSATVWSNNDDVIDLGSTIPVPGTDVNFYTGIAASDINDAGQVIGNGFFYRYTDGPFVWTSSTGVRNLNTLIDPSLGWSLSTVGAINNKGQIVGIGTNQDGYGAAFLLTPRSAEPVPEPLTIGATLLAGAGLTSLRYRQRQLHRLAKVAK